MSIVKKTKFWLKVSTIEVVGHDPGECYQHNVTDATNEERHGEMVIRPRWSMLPAPDHSAHGHKAGDAAANETGNVVGFLKSGEDYEHDVVDEDTHA